MHVALLRGINVGNCRKVPMQDLVVAATKAGFRDVRTYIQSGNLVIDAGAAAPDKVACELEKMIEERFGFHVDVVARTKAQWKRYAAGSPFPHAEKAHPNHLLLGLCKAPPKAGFEKAFLERATLGEKVKKVGDAVWVDFVGGVGRSKLTPAFFEKAIGSPVTMRNWNTVLKLEEMLSAT